MAATRIRRSRRCFTTAPRIKGGNATLEAIRQRFGDKVAEIVADCTDTWTEPKPDWRTRKRDNLAKLPSKSRRSLLVALADKTHNAEAVLFDHRALGDALWPRFKGGAEGTRRYYFNEGTAKPCSGSLSVWSERLPQVNADGSLLDRAGAASPNDRRPFSLLRFLTDELKLDAHTDGPVTPRTAPSGRKIL